MGSMSTLSSEHLSSEPDLDFALHGLRTPCSPIQWYRKHRSFTTLQEMSGLFTVFFTFTLAALRLSPLSLCALESSFTRTMSARCWFMYVYYIYIYVYVDNREANVYEVRLDGEALLSREETKEHLALHHLSWRSFPLNLPGTSLCLACLDRFLSISRRDWCHKPTRSPHGITLHSKVPFSWNLPSPSSHPSNTSTSQSLCKATNMSHCEVETQVMIPIQNSTLNRIATAPSSVVSEMGIARAIVRVSHLKIPMWIPLRRKIGRSAGPELEEDADELEEEEPPKNINLEVPNFYICILNTLAKNNVKRKINCIKQLLRIKRNQKLVACSGLSSCLAEAWLVIKPTCRQRATLCDAYTINSEHWDADVEFLGAPKRNRCWKLKVTFDVTWDGQYLMILMSKGRSTKFEQPRNYLRFLQRTKSQDQNRSMKLSVPARGALAGVGFDVVRPHFVIWSIKCDDNWSNSLVTGCPTGLNRCRRLFRFFRFFFVKVFWHLATKRFFRSPSICSTKTGACAFAGRGVIAQAWHSS